ncbi:ATP-binding protein [Pseudactinotalea sp. Z1732]|uniref:ATP-binding protein n=1 Tax=Pseudactinotalea sp. Z1732 TaxID=3413026 RepID=UPI003C7D1F4B
MGAMLERDAALRALRRTVDVAADGRGSVAIVAGELGMGKTMLVSSFAPTTDAEVYWGTCDDLSTSRPFGPFWDIAAQAPWGLQSMLDAGDPPYRLHTRVLEELAAAERPTVIVIEDIHWADDATIDAITVLGRRIADLPAVLVLTLRSGEAAPDHPVQSALGVLHRVAAVRVELPPLSRAAVARLSGEENADWVYDVTGGNPFFVTELVADLPGDLPQSVTSAILGRCARLDPSSRHLVELVSVAPTRLPIAALDAALPEWTAAAEAPERLRLLTLEPTHVRFRHELIRRAVHSSLTATRRRHLHAQVLEALLATGGAAADIVHHAEAAGSTHAAASHALAAAREATALESHREAFEYYRRAAEFAHEFPIGDRAGLYEAYAEEACHVGDLSEAFNASDRAIALHREHGDVRGVGRCKTARARFNWLAGDSRAAWEQAQGAIAVLEPLGATTELASAHSQLCDLATRSGNSEQTQRSGHRAVRLAEELGNEDARWRALVAMAAMGMQLNPAEAGTLHGVIDGARRAGAHDTVMNGLVALAFFNLCWVQPEAALRSITQGLALVEERQRDVFKDHFETLLAWLKARSGYFDEARALAERVIGRRASSTIAGLQAQTVLAEVAVRRGDDDAAARLSDLIALVNEAGEPKLSGPVLELEIEWALTHSRHPPVGRTEQVLATIAKEGAEGGFLGARLAAWATIVGVPIVFRGVAPRPHAAMIRRAWPEAAQAFEARGWRYDQALLLSMCDDEAELATAVRITQRLGAKPLEAHLRRKMRAHGMTVRRGPIRSTRANPAGLTERQAEVLALLAQNLTNAEIGARLAVSQRTIEHHVAAILTGLAVDNRRAAVRRAIDLGVLSPSPE